MVDLKTLKRVNKTAAFRSGLEPFDLVTPLTQRGVPLNVGSDVGEPAQR